MFGLEVLTGKALSFDTNLSIKPVKFASVSAASCGYLRHCKYARLATSTSVNNCYILLSP